MPAKLEVLEAFGFYAVPRSTRCNMLVESITATLQDLGFAMEWDMPSYDATVRLLFGKDERELLVMLPPTLPEDVSIAQMSIFAVAKALLQYAENGGTLEPSGRTYTK